MSESLFGIKNQPNEPIDFSVWLLQDVERQRQDLCETFFEMITDLQRECDAFIQKEKSDPQKLLEACKRSQEEVKWVLDMPQSTAKDHLRAHKDAFLRNIACLDLFLRDLHKVRSVGSSPEFLECVFLSPGDVHAGWSHTLGLFSRASEHLAAIKMLNEWERYLAGRRKGAQNTGPDLTEKNYRDLIDALVKGLIQENSSPPRKHSNATLVDSCYAAIMELWEARPFFYFDHEKVKQAVTDSLVKLGKTAERKKTAFERRRRPVSFQLPDEFSQKVREWKAWQDGIALALLEVLEGRFGAVSDDDYEKIESASPEQLNRWLRHAGKADSVDQVLSNK